MRGLACVLCLLVAAAGTCRADDIETVIVTAAHMPEPVGQSAFSLVALDSAALAQSPRLDAALEAVPGASLFRRDNSVSANPTTQGLSLRAIAPSGAGRALVLLDGVPMNDPFGNWVIWTALPSEDIAQAEIVRGAGSGPYGAGALTGTVALSERSADGLAIADASGGSLGEARAAASGGTAIDGVELFASASAMHSDGWTPVLASQRGAADRPLWFDGASASLRVQSDLGSGVGASARLGWYEEARGNGVSGGGAAASGSMASVSLARNANAAHFGWRLQAWTLASNLTNLFTSEAANRATAAISNDQYATPALGWGLNAAALGENGHWRWEAGADLRDDAGESRELYTPIAGVFTDRRRAGGRLIAGGLYGEVAYTDDLWLLTAGARGDEWATSQGHLVQTAIASGAVLTQSNPPSRDGLLPTGRLGAKREIGGGQYLRAAAYAGFRAPSLNELYRPFRAGTVVTNANAALVPERLYGAELGWGGDADGWVWNATGFYNRLASAITNVTQTVTPSLTTQQRQNAGNIDALGLEGDVSKALGDGISLHGAFGLTDARVHAHTTAAQLNGKRPAQDPLATVTGGVAWQALEALRLAANLRFESSRYDDDLNTHRLSSAFTLDLRADWQLSDAWRTYVALSNAADAHIAYAYNAPGVDLYAAPRTVSVGVSYAP